MAFVAKTIAIKSLLAEFNDQDIDCFKNYLWQLLNIKNDTEFINRFLEILYNPLSLDMLNNLQQKANEIFKQSQYFVQPKNQFESLPSGVIQNIATYLSQKESISLGYANQYLYTESQKTSYIVADSHHNAYEFMITENCEKLYRRAFSMYDFPSSRPVITNNQVSHLAAANLPGCSYSCPMAYIAKYRLEKRELDAIVRDDKKKSIFNNLFRKIKCFAMDADSPCLELVPIDILFNKKIHGDSKLKVFDLTETPNESFLTFATNYSTYVSCKDVEVREMEHLCIGFYECRKDQYKYIVQSINAFDQNFTSLKIRQGIFSADSVKLLTQITHSNLESLQFGTQGGVQVTKKLNQSFLDDVSLENSVCCPKLKIFQLDIVEIDNHMHRLLLSNNVTIFESNIVHKLLFNVEQYKINFAEDTCYKDWKDNTHRYYVCQFLKDNLGRRSVCDKVKYVSFDIQGNTKREDKMFILGKTAAVFVYLSQFNKEHLENAFQNTFECFSIRWTLDARSYIIIHEMIYNRRCLDFFQTCITHATPNSESRIVEFDKNLNIFDVKTDFSLQSLANILAACDTWMERKFESNTSRNTSAKFEIRLHLDETNTVLTQL